MPVVRPAGIQCPLWEPVSLGSKRCRYYLEPKEGETGGLCSLPGQLLCVEWVRRYGTDEQKKQLAPMTTPPRATAQQDPDAPPPLALSSPEPKPEPPPKPQPPARLKTVQGEVDMAPPHPFEPAKEIDASSLEALELAGVEVELSAPHLNGGITLVPARTGRTDRSEMTFREAATIRLIVDCFPGAHVTAYRAGCRETQPEEPLEEDPLS